MLCEGISDSQTYAEIFRILCQRAGITCYAVDGLKNGQLYKWNILELDGRFYHADPYAAELAGLVQKKPAPGKKSLLGQDHHYLLRCHPA